MERVESILAGDGQQTGDERERLLEELTRTNRRLMGALDVVLRTLDSPDTDTLFERMLEELRHMTGALGVTLYLATSDGFRLEGVSSSIDGEDVPRFLPRKGGLLDMLVRQDQPICLDVLPDEGEGTSGQLVAQDHDAANACQVDRELLPPFASVMVVPVRFGGRVIALLQAGWREQHAIPSDDVELLGSMSRYLAVQLAGALNVLRARRRAQLMQKASDLRSKLVRGLSSPERDQVVLEAVECDLGCRCAPVAATHEGAGACAVRLPLSGRPEGIDEGLLVADGPVVALAAEGALGAWLRERGEYCIGAMVACDTVDDEHLSFLALRPDGREPFDEHELEYLRRVSEAVRAVEADERDRKCSQRVAQALQMGMRNDLQEVPGVTARGAYAPATEAALVGSDFYLLVRLPERRACVIVGDVSGKGVEAAAMAAAVRTALGAYAWEDLTPAQMVGRVNDLLLGMSNAETYASLFVGVVDLADAELVYCSAGHPPALLWHPEVRELALLSEQSGLAGAFHDMAYHDGRVALSAGDVLFLYTDGAAEARGEKGGFFGEDGMRDAMVREAARGFEGLVERMMQSVEEFAGGHLVDDVAMVALRVDEVGQ